MICPISQNGEKRNSNNSVILANKVVKGTLVTNIAEDTVNLNRLIG